MRHRKAGRKLGRNNGQRKALMRNLAISLFRHERLRSTDQKCKELRPVAEKIITIAKNAIPQPGEENNPAAVARAVHARRRILQIIPNKEVVARVCDEIAPRFVDRSGGYIRILKVGPRHGDNAPCSIIELVERTQVTT